jgi:molybdopterin-containing oxidoreductase family iron-sulfur binding subunit
MTEDAPTRRSLLKLFGLGGTAFLAACRRDPVRYAVPYLVPPEEITPGIPVKYVSTCTACPAACGLLVTVLDGRPVKLEGLPSHPLSRGGLCAIGQADVRDLYDAGRLRAPILGGRKTTWEALDREVAAKLTELRTSGKALYVLAPTLTSPTLREAVVRFLEPYGGILVEHDPGAHPSSAALEASELLTGHALLPSLDIGRADLLVCFGADLVGTGPEPVFHTRALADRRRAATERSFRHVQIEGSLSSTGANADERWPLSAAERRALALWLLSKAVADAPGASSVTAALAASGAVQAPVPLPRAEALLAELLAARGRSLVVSGANDLVEQAAVALLNRFLENEGATLHPANPSLVRRGLDRDLAAFLEALSAGSVGGVIVLDVDPVDQLPDGGTLADLLRKLPLSVAITDRPTATAAACRAVAAAHHGLEQWGDFKPREDVVTLAQPTIRPLFGTRHPGENFLHWSGAAVTDFRLHLMAAWRERTSTGTGFEPFWNRAVSNGTALELAAALVSPARRDGGSLEAAVKVLRSATPAAPSEALEVDLIEEIALGDGRRAHNPWLRELPDPMTRVSWTPCVRVAPDRARALGVTDGDTLRVDVAGRSVALPARLTPGQHPRVLGLPVGYGRLDGDADAAARNVYRVARIEQGRLFTAGLAARAERTGSAGRLPLMQAEGVTRGRPIVHQVAAPEAQVEGAESRNPQSLWPELPQSSPKWEMVIDLDACTGCSACVVACQAENNLPVVGAEEMRRNRDMYWLRIDRYFVGDAANPDVLFEPMLCQQCENAPCETVCPVAATVHSEDGLNMQVYNRCVGTRYCANNCPYKVRRFNWFDHPIEAPVERLALNPNVVYRSRGVMEKCTFCVQRIQASRIAMREEGREDWRGAGVQTACQQSCPARAITFGDATDPRSEVARLKQAPRAFQVLAELGVKPSVTYLARVRNREGVAAGGRS